MSQTRTRYFLLGSAAIVVAGLVAGTAAYMGVLPARALASQAGPDDLALVPAKAALVAYANVSDVMHSEFRQRLTTAMDSKGEARIKFQEETGIDIERDIDSVVAASMPSADQGGGHDFGFVALRGRFDTGRIEALVSSKGGRLDEYRGARLLLPPADEDHDDGAHADAEHAEEPETEGAPEQMRARHHGHPTLALVNANLVVLGSMAAVRGAIDRYHDQTASILSDGEFVRMLDNVASGSTVWAIGRSSVLADVQSNEIASQLPGVKWVAASGHVNGGLSATLRAETFDAEAGKNLRDIVQGALAVARLHVNANPELKPLLQGLQVEGTGTSVAVTVAMPSELLDVILGQMQTHAARLHSRPGTSAEE